MITNGTISFRVARASRVLGSAGILPVAAGILRTAPHEIHIEAVRQHAGQSGQNARAPQILVMSI